MLVFRETQQSFIKRSLLRKESGREFVQKQLGIAKKIIEHLNPKIIVVSNTQARAFIGADKYYNPNVKYGNVSMGYEFDFDINKGTHKIKGEFTPYVFLTSMLSGQRALDKGSRERLVWHINKTLK